MKESKNQIYAFLQATLTDISISRYEVHWERISQMQQNASILLAVLSLALTADFGILALKDSNGYLLLKNEIYSMVTPLLLTCIFLILLSGFWLFKVIFPKKLNDLPKSPELLNLIENQLKEHVFIDDDKDKDKVKCKVNPIIFIVERITTKIEDAIGNLHIIVQKNQHCYFKGLWISIFSIFLTLVCYAFIIISTQPSLLLNFFLFILIIVLVILSIIISINKIKL